MKDINVPPLLMRGGGGKDINVGVSVTAICMKVGQLKRI